MTELLTALTHLSALRERQALEVELTTLVRLVAVPHSHAVQLVRAIGTHQQLHWQVRSAYREAPDTTERDTVWADWSHLPRLEAFPQRLCALAHNQAQVDGTAPCRTIFPLATEDGAPCVLEIDTDAPLSTQSLHAVTAVLQIYRNLLGLLDYGEKDALTGLLNRKSFDSAFVRAAQQLHNTPHGAGQIERRAPCEEGVFWMAMVDIDHFKRINDSFGHLMGDEVLVLLGRIMRNTFRTNDQLYRFGGEEFVVMMHCPGNAQAKETLERFRHAVESFPFAQVGQVTISIGFTQLHRHDTPDLAFARADRAVYHAKSSGRNQVCSFAALVASGNIDAPLPPQDDIEFF